jgi:hypothetical protein
LVPEKNVPFYAIWVGKFLSFLNLNRNIKEKSTLPTFMEENEEKRGQARICTSISRRMDY